MVHKVFPPNSLTFSIGGVNQNREAYHIDLKVLLTGLMSSTNYTLLVKTAKLRCTGYEYGLNTLTPIVGSQEIFALIKARASATFTDNTEGQDSSVNALFDSAINSEYVYTEIGRSDWRIIPMGTIAGPTAYYASHYQRTFNVTKQIRKFIQNMNTPNEDVIPELWFGQIHIEPTAQRAATVSCDMILDLDYELVQKKPTL